MSDFAALPAEARELALGCYRLLAPNLTPRRAMNEVLVLTQRKQLAFAAVHTGPDVGLKGIN